MIYSMHHILVALVNTCANCSCVTVYVLSPPLASVIINFNSSSVMVQPSSIAIFLRFSRVMTFLSSKAKSWKALSISSQDSFSFILAVIICKNSVQSMELVLSLSFCSVLIQEISLLISSFFGQKPRARKATFNSFMSITPDPSASNKSNASFMSFFCFSVNYWRKDSFDLPFFTPFFASLFIRICCTYLNYIHMSMQVCVCVWMQIDVYAPLCNKITMLQQIPQKSKGSDDAKPSTDTPSNSFSKCRLQTTKKQLSSIRLLQQQLVSSLNHTLTSIHSKILTTHQSTLLFTNTFERRRHRYISQQLQQQKQQQSTTMLLNKQEKVSQSRLHTSMRSCSSFVQHRAEKEARWEQARLSKAKEEGWRKHVYMTIRSKKCAQVQRKAMRNQLIRERAMTNYNRKRNEEIGVIHQYQRIISGIKGEQGQGGEGQHCSFVTEQ